MITLPSHTSHALQPLDVNGFKPFKTTSRKEINNNMVKNNYNEPNKATFATWVNKALYVVLSKKNIKNGFKVTRIWLFNPKAMDGRTKPSEFYVADYNNASNEDNEENSDEVINDTKDWGEDGIVVELINITTTIDDIATTRTNVDGHEKLPRYYVEEPTSLGIIEKIGT